ncbi:DUF883 family protein [Labrys monachus]|uniref:ElaB/YqjD/DUF883 family membrane-anchored ribosome-binding protein n=1 Tax=Labrys monachus TaxID=217067 RepID=A0ABU0FL95_9HYPH|nr:hypothetical protein [Labrys monachus]MDQ0395301.1 ElaB/YqjD/DUF883 family membrane-anchored ribosome-binding protein [Labrys monachus]
MADNVSIDDMRKEFERQLADLKKEVGAINKSLADRGADAYEKARDAAGDTYGRVKEQASGSLRQARQQAQLVSDTVRENPGTAATVLSSAGIVGFLLGLVVGATMVGDSRRW